MLKKLLLSANSPQKKTIKKRRIFSTSDIFSPEKKIKSPSFYQKIYGIVPETQNQPKKDKEKTTKKSNSLRNSFQKPKIKKIKYQFRRITNPKLPFSKRTIEPKDVVKNRIKLSKPSKIFHDFETIQWLRRKFSENIINKSIYSLLPNNGKPVIPEDESEEDKRHRKMMEYLESLKGPIGREKYCNINPKYFFNRATFDTILKLKKIFLEFDADGNRRMELDEMLEMFESNKISANINDLVELFFKGKKFKEKEVMKLYLNFHQFMNFALTKDQDFRQFMRNIKERVEKKKKDGLMKEENDSECEKDGYFPMTFKSLLDYFIDKGKERNWKIVINKAIDEMNEIIDKKKDINCHNIKFNTNSIVNSPKKIINQRTLKSKNSIKSFNLNNQIDKEDLINLNIEEDLDIDYEKQLKNINFKKIIEAFSHLFKIVQVNSPQNKNSNNNINNINNNNNNNNTNTKSITKTESEQNIIKNIEKKNNNNNGNKNSLIKCSKSLVNTVSTHSQENIQIKQYLSNSTKGELTNSFYNIQNNKSELFIKDHQMIKNKNRSLCNNESSRKIKNIIDKNIISNRYYDSKNLKKMKYLGYFKPQRNFPSIYRDKSINGNKKELPTFYHNNSLFDLKANNNNITMLNGDNKNNVPFLPLTKAKIRYDILNKGVFDRNQINKNKLNKKFCINYYGGKINVFNKSNITTQSTPKLDYVPMKLLSDSIQDKTNSENIINL